MISNKHFIRVRNKLIVALVALGILAAGVFAQVRHVSALALGVLPSFVTGLDTSGYHTMAIKADGSLWGWGLNRYGQLGDGTNVDRLAPTRICTSYSWASIAVAGTRTLAIKTDGSLWAWGHIFSAHTNSTNTYIPTRICDNYNWAKVSADATLLAAIKTDGSLWILGYARGEGSAQLQAEPLGFTRLGVSYNWASVSVGGSQVRAIKTDGSLWTYNTSINTQRGDSSNGLTQVGDENRWLSVTGSCVLAAAVTTCGSIWSWDGQDSHDTSHAAAQTANTPTRICAANNWICVTAGTNHVVALQHGGSLWTWSDAGIPMQIGTSTNWARTLASSRTSTYAMKTDGSVWVIGYNETGATSGDIFTSTMIWNPHSVQDATLQVGTAVGVPGDTVRVKVSLQGNPGIAGFNLTFTYNGQLLTPVEMNDGDIRRGLGGSVFTSNINPVTGTITTVWASAYEKSNEGLFYIYFTINDIDLYEGQQITIPINAFVTEMKRLNHDNVSAYVQNGFVAISHIPYGLLWGDVNQDGYVDIFDLVRLAQHIAGLPNMGLAGLGLVAADVFFDGAVDLSDLIHLAQYLASEDMSSPDVVLGPGMG